MRATRKRGIGGALLAAAGAGLLVFRLLVNFKDATDTFLFIRDHWPLVSSFLKQNYDVFVVGLSTVAAILSFQFWRRRQLRALPLDEITPIISEKFNGNLDLLFRYANKPSDIVELGTTEDYGEHGTSDTELATEWWRRYPEGNRLAVYRGKIVGGIDIWPLTKQAYELILNGDLSDLDLRPIHFRVRARHRSGSYWYLGSISIAFVWRRRRIRQELLLRLLVDAISSWLDRQPTFPAHFVAIAWTDAGRNFLRRHDFNRYYVRNLDGRHNDEIFTRIFPERDGVESLIKDFRMKLSNRPIE